MRSQHTCFSCASDIRLNSSSSNVSACLRCMWTLSAPFWVNRVPQSVQWKGLSRV